jgi:hypothetical protein
MRFKQALNENYSAEDEDDEDQVKEDENVEPEFDGEAGDISTEDHENWYQHGKLYVKGNIQDVKLKMEQDKFYPNVFFISDHGNAHLIKHWEK